MIHPILTNGTAFLTLSIYRPVFVVTQSGRLYSGGGAPCLPLTLSGILQPTLLDGRSCSAPPSDPRERRRREAAHTIAQTLFDQKYNNQKYSFNT